MPNTIAALTELERKLDGIDAKLTLLLRTRRKGLAERATLDHEGGEEARALLIEVNELLAGSSRVDPDVLSRHEVEVFLDESLRFWRGLRDGTVQPSPPLTAEAGAGLAPAYIDCLQSIRVSLFGEPLE